MMFGFGWLMMLLVVGLPILLIVLLVGGAAGLFHYRSQNQPVTQIQTPVNPPAGITTASSAPAARYCSHCGAGLQSDWTHCPQCGAPIG